MIRYPTGSVGLTMTDYDIGVRLIERHMPQCPGPGCAAINEALAALQLDPPLTHR